MLRQVVRQSSPYVWAVDAGIQLRILPRLDGFWAAVVASTLGFSGIRLHNSTPPI